jgi:hypothetical protein
MNGDKWNEAFSAIKGFRRHLREAHGIYINKELHASKFAAGKGRIANRPLDARERVAVFGKVMRFVTNCRFFRIVSSANTNEFVAFERLINLLNRTADKRGHYVLLFCDAGQEATFTKRIRKMRVHNPIWSNRGVWEDTGQETRNIPISQMIEDPIFKDSKSSYFIQLVDFCAYALLRSERPIESRTALGYDRMYDILQPVTAPINNRKDPRGLGIIR